MSEICGTRPSPVRLLFLVIAKNAFIIRPFFELVTKRRQETFRDTISRIIILLKIATIKCESAVLRSLYKYTHLERIKSYAFDCALEQRPLIEASQCLRFASIESSYKIIRSSHNFKAFLLLKKKRKQPRTCTQNCYQRKVMRATRQSVRKKIENQPKLQHVVIAGAGITGLSTAYYLATKYNIRSVLVDWSGTIAPGASGKAAGFLARHWSDGTPTEQLSHRSFDLHQELADAFGADSIQYRRLTCVSVNQSTKMKKLKRVTESSKADKLEWLDRESNEVFIRRVQDMGNETDIAQVTPKLLCEKLWEEVQRRGGLLVKGRVTNAVHDDESGNFIGAKLDDGRTVPGDALLYACGPWSANIMYGIKGHAVTIPTERTLSQVVFFYDDDDHDDEGGTECEVYVRPNNTAFCTALAGEIKLVTEEPGKETVEADVIDGVLEAVRGCSGTEGLLGGDPILQSACYQPVTSDFLPVIGALVKEEAGGERCYMASGNNCWGILWGPATGECIADLIATGTTRLNIRDFNPSRFPDLRPVPQTN
jgi:glycine/D-amino acid oxidase-like deaminating enzyme